jgi:selenocysteine lyase/cysteine desulfurase
MSSTRRAFMEQLAHGTALAALGPAVLPSPMAGSGPSSTSDEAFWTALKREFLFADRFIPLNAANMCPSPRMVVEAIEQATRHVDRDVSFQSRARFDELRERVRAGLARLLDATPEEVAIVRNTSEGNNIVVAGLDLARGDEVLLWDENHPTNNVAWLVRAAREGFTVRRFRVDPATADPDAMLSHVVGAIGDRTRVLAFSDISNTSGTRVPTAALCRAARARGIWTHVDGAQTFGATRVSMREMGCDSYTASGQKWLMGPREIGVLYLRADRIRTVWPGVVGSGWGEGVEGPAGARRFETMGQRNDATLAGLDAALAFIERIGIERIAARTEALGRRMREGLAAVPGLRLRTPTAPGTSLGVAVAAVPGGDARPLFERLYREFGVIGAPAGGLRFCPHVYNTMADLDRALDAVATVVRS